MTDLDGPFTHTGNWLRGLAQGQIHGLLPRSSTQCEAGSVFCCVRYLCVFLSAGGTMPRISSLPINDTPSASLTPVSSTQSPWSSANHAATVDWSNLHMSLPVCTSPPSAYPVSSRQISWTVAISICVAQHPRGVQCRQSSTFVGSGGIRPHLDEESPVTMIFVRCPQRSGCAMD